MSSKRVRIVREYNPQFAEFVRLIGEILSVIFPMYCLWDCCVQEILIKLLMVITRAKNLSTHTFKSLAFKGLKSTCISCVRAHEAS